MNDNLHQETGEPEASKIQKDDIFISSPEALLFGFGFPLVFFQESAQKKIVSGGITFPSHLIRGIQMVKDW